MEPLSPQRASSIHFDWIIAPAARAADSRSYFMELWFESHEIGSKLVQFVAKCKLTARDWYVVLCRTKTSERSNRDNCWHISFPLLTLNRVCIESRDRKANRDSTPFAYQLSVDSWYVDSQFKLLISLGSCAIILDLCDYANRRACVVHRWHHSISAIAV